MSTPTATVTVDVPDIHTYTRALDDAVHAAGYREFVIWRKRPSGGRVTLEVVARHHEVRAIADLITTTFG